MKINIEKGLFRIYIVWNVVLLIIGGIIVAESSSYKKDEHVVAVISLIIAPWIIHYVLKWIIIR